MTWMRQPIDLGTQYRHYLLKWHAHLATQCRRLRTDLELPMGDEYDEFVRGIVIGVQD